MTDPLDPIARAQKAAAELREVIRQAHEAAQDLTAATRSARILVDEYAAAQVQAVLDSYTARAQSAADRFHADWKADVQRHLDKAVEALSGLVSVVEMKLDFAPGRHEQMTADIVIDLRGQVPAFYAANDPAGAALLRQAPYKVVVGPANQVDTDRT